MDNDDPTKREFVVAGGSVFSLFLSELPKSYPTGKIAKIRVEFYAFLKTKEEIPVFTAEEMNHKGRMDRRARNELYFHNQVEDLADVAIVHRSFGFEAWFAADEPSKKKTLTREVFEALGACTDKFGWERAPLEAALKACEETGYQNAWEVTRLKSKTSPDRRRQAAVFAEYGLFAFDIYALLKEGPQTAPRKRLLKRFDGLEKGGMYPENAHNALAGKTKWENGDFVLYGKDGKEVGRVMNGAE